MVAKMNDDLLERYRIALEEIADLENMKEVSGFLEDIGVSDHQIKEGGWVPIHPRTLRGFQHASRIAKIALGKEKQMSAKTTKVAYFFLCERCEHHVIREPASWCEKEGCFSVYTKCGAKKAIEYLVKHCKKEEE